MMKQLISTIWTTRILISHHLRSQVPHEPSHTWLTGQAIYHLDHLVTKTKQWSLMDHKRNHTGFNGLPRNQTVIIHGSQTEHPHDHLVIKTSTWSPRDHITDWMIILKIIPTLSSSSSSCQTVTAHNINIYITYKSFRHVSVDRTVWPSTNLCPWPRTRLLIY